MALQVMPEEIRELRAARKTRFLVTGATGFLGTHVVQTLLARGHSVTALVRDGRGTSAEDRLRRTLGWLEATVDPQKVSVVAGDVAERRFGLSGEAWESLASRVDEVVHCAASTSFSEGKRQELERVNVGGTENTLELAVDGRARAFHLVSTAYAIGCAGGEGRDPIAFTNAYEETKYKAEATARRMARESDFALSIYRPTVVYGDSQTGRSLRFNALYHPVKTVVFLRDLYLQDRQHGGGKARELGVDALPDGRLRLPLRVETDPGATLNMVPVDYFSRAFVALLEAHPEGGLFPIATDERLGVETVVDYTARLFGIVGLEAAPTDAFRQRPRSVLERLFEDYTRLYRPYMIDRRTFDDSASRPTLDAAGIRCPRFTYDLFVRLMTYAESVDWGKRTFR